jgi:hypothetical protein
MGRHRYRFRIEERVTARVAAAFPELEAEHTDSGTTLTGEVTDEAALHGLLDRLYVLGLTISSVERLRP